VYRGKYLGQPVAIKQLKINEMNEAGINEEDEERRRAFEEFRHEVWIMRCPPRSSDHPRHLMKKLVDGAYMQTAVWRIQIYCG